MSGTKPQFLTFETRTALAQTLAERVAEQLSTSVAERDSALLAVSGGTTPGLFFDELSLHDIAWPKVTVTLVDERFVDEVSPRSNAALVRSRLLKNRAGRARFLPLFADGLDADQAARAAEKAIFPDERARPDVVILGMGADGHTASFFPDAAELDTLLDPTNRPGISAVHADSAGEARLTMTLPAITSAEFLAIHIEGEEKRRVMDTALQDGSTLPISAVLRAAKSAVPIYWAP